MKAVPYAEEVIDRWVDRYLANESTFDISVAPGFGVRASQSSVHKALQARGVLRSQKDAVTQANARRSKTQ